MIVGCNFVLSGILWYRLVELGVGVIIIRLSIHILIVMLRK